MEGVDGESMHRVAEPVEIAGGGGGRADGEGKAEPMLILLLPGGHAEFHDGFADQVGVGQVGGVNELQ